MCLLDSQTMTVGLTVPGQGPGGSNLRFQRAITAPEVGQRRRVTRPSNFQRAGRERESVRARACFARTSICPRQIPSPMQLPTLRPCAAHPTPALLRPVAGAVDLTPPPPFCSLDFASRCRPFSRLAARESSGSHRGGSPRACRPFTTSSATPSRPWTGAASAATGRPLGGVQKKRHQIVGMSGSVFPSPLFSGGSPSCRSTGHCTFLVWAIKNRWGTCSAAGSLLGDHLAARRWKT